MAKVLISREASLESLKALSGAILEAAVAADDKINECEKQLVDAGACVWAWLSDEGTMRGNTICYGIHEGEWRILTDARTENQRAVVNSSPVVRITTAERLDELVARVLKMTNEQVGA